MMFRPAILKSANLKNGVFKDDRGVMTIELALTLPVFLLVTMSALEFAWYFFQATALENAVLHASRYGVTGATAQQISRTDRVRAIISEQTFGRIDMDQLELTTEVYEQFDAIDVAEPFEDTNADGIWNNGEVFTDINGNGVWDSTLAIPGLGDGNDIVLYRARVPAQSLTGLFGWITDATILESTVAVRNEPY